MSVMMARTCETHDGGTMDDGCVRCLHTWRRLAPTVFHLCVVRTTTNAKRRGPRVSETCDLREQRGLSRDWFVCSTQRSKRAAGLCARAQLGERGLGFGGAGTRRAKSLNPAGRKQPSHHGSSFGRIYSPPAGSSSGKGAGRQRQASRRAMRSSTEPSRFA